MDFKIDLELTLAVESKISGRYIKATHYNPPEYPEIDELKVFLGTVDISEQLNAKDLSYIEEQVWEQHNYERLID
jgi:hypothetical protein|tara:strand:- start:7622 stop:7846 length:225 start_codon:yes stop_codon:yes gene_type:complete